MKQKKISTVEVTKKMFEEGMTVKQIALERDIELGTVISHLEKIKELDPSFNLYSIKDGMSASKFQKIYKAFSQVGTSEGGKRPLNPVKDIVGSAATFEEIRMVRLFL